MPRPPGLTATGRIVDAYRALDRVAAVGQGTEPFGFVVGSTMSASTACRRRVRWPAATRRSLGRGRLRPAGAVGQRCVDDGRRLRPAVGAPTGRCAVGTAWGFRVRARDGAGNWGEWSTATTVTPVRYQETTSRAT